MSRSNRQQYKQQYKQRFETQKIPRGGVPLDSVEAAKSQQEHQIRARVDGLAAAIFSNNVSAYSEFRDSDIEEVARQSYRAALIFARVAWGVNAQMVSQPEAPSAPPQPIAD